MLMNSRGQNYSRIRIPSTISWTECENYNVRLIICMIQRISRTPSRCTVDNFHTFPVNLRYFLSKMSEETCLAAPKFGHLTVTPAIADRSEVFLHRAAPPQRRTTCRLSLCIFFIFSFFHFFHLFHLFHFFIFSFFRTCHGFQHTYYQLHSSRLSNARATTTQRNVSKSWRSDVPVILPGWEHHMGGSRSTPTVHQC